MEKLRMMGFRLLFLLVMMVFVSLTINAQTKSSNKERIAKIDSEIKKVVAEENYTRAAELKKEKELRLEMEKELAAENYQRVAEIQKELKEENGTASDDRIAELEKELKVAIGKEDYERAGVIQKEINDIKQGKTTTSSTSSSVKSAGISEPEFINQVYLLLSDGSLKSLEKADGQLKTSAGGFGGYASATSSYMIPGPKSDVRLKRDQLHFVVKTYPGVDPAEQIKLNHLAIRGRRSPSRYADAFKSSSAMFHSETGAVSENEVAITFKSIGENVFEINVEGNLPNGEYAFMYISKMFAFGLIP